MIKAGRFCCAHVVLTTMLLSAAAKAERAPDALGSARAHSTLFRRIVAQATHAPPGVRGSGGQVGAGGSSNGSHAPPPVPGSSDVGAGSSGRSHAPPPVPGSTDAGGGGAAGDSHGPPLVPGSAGSPRGTHASPPVPMMGGNP